jgi:hypothetical protein
MKFTIGATRQAIVDLGTVLASSPGRPDDVDLLVEEYLGELRRWILTRRGDLPDALPVDGGGDHLFRSRFFGNVWVIYEIVDTPRWFWRSERHVSIISFRELPERGSGRPRRTPHN